MLYPFISQYVDSILNAEEHFCTLTNLRPVLGNNGKPIMRVGHFAVVFKMKEEKTGKLFAVKCFLEDQPDRSESYRMIADELKNVSSTFLTKFKYLDNELSAISRNADGTFFPVLLMDWVEGVNLHTFIHQHLDNKSALRRLAYQFGKLATWLMQQPFAHGDIKPANIMVRNDGSLVLIDYDGMYVPKMMGQKSHELGNPDFRHPLRTQDDFNERIDDFPLVSMLLSLRVIADEPAVLDKYDTSDRLLFSESDYKDIHSCHLLKVIYPSVNNEINKLVSLFTIALTQGDLSEVSSQLLSLDKPKETPIVLNKKQEPLVGLETLVTDKDLANALEDKYGVKYSKDRKRLLKASFNLNSNKIRRLFRGHLTLKSYKLTNETKVICNRAFYDCSSLEQVTIPDSVTIIGNMAFSNCSSLEQVTIPDSVTSIGDWAFSGCSSLQQVTIPYSVTSIRDYVFYDCSSLQQVTIPDSVTSIGEKAFSGCKSLQQVTIPDSVSSIGNHAFENCSSLQKITIPDSVTSIGIYAFANTFIQEITIPDSVTSIGEEAFSLCLNLQVVTISDSVTNIGDGAFSCCFNLLRVKIPNSVTSIGKGTFDGCSSLEKVAIPNSVTSIGEEAFSGCKSLQQVTIPDSVTSLGGKAFSGCESIQQITIPDSVTSIGEKAFSDCKSLQQVTIPESVTSIEDSAFSDCLSLEQVTIPDSVTNIGKETFSNCPSLEQIFVNSASYVRIKNMLSKELNSRLTIKD